MSAKTLSADDIGQPEFPPGTAQDGIVFDLSSHRRAREALELALAVHEPGFNVFVLGEDRSGRLTSTVAFLEQSVEPLPAPDDWVYVNNFQRPWEPIPVRLRQSEGRRLHDRMQHLLAQLGEAVQAAFGGDSFQKRMQSEGETARNRINARIKEIQEEARAVGLDVLQTEQGPMIVAVDEKGEAVGPDALNAEQRAALEQHGPRIAEDIREVGRRTAEAQAELRERADELGRQTADYTFGPLIDAFVAEFAMHSGLTRWLVELRNDMVDNYRMFLPAPPDSERPREFDPAHRYAINVFVDNRAGRHAPIVIEANPTYENLFGRIEYRQSQRSMETDFTLIRAGALHRANGGVLVLRADAVASAPGVWPYLKAALRDRVVRIEEPYRFNGPAVAGAPTPGPIPLDLKVVMIASPRWYYTFYAADPEFQNYFGVKADIDPEVEATAGNLETYGGMIRAMALRREKGLACEDGAVSWLLGLASRWAADRGKLSSQFERIDDLIAEAQVLARRAGATSISRELVVQAYENRRRRNSRIEDRIQEGIADRSVMITTTGTMVGQVNALTVRDFGDHAFGTPSRVTARASVGRRGVLNIERDVGLGGPIQQKGALVLQGWLSGRFARTYPLSFDVSITFEQSYGGVDGDSASLAELVAILSDLSGVPVRQGLAITGSVNQRGEAQAIGGAHHKVEGFFRTCVEAGTLDGSQGVAVPAANEDNLVLNAEVEAAVRDGAFSLYSLATIEDAVELFLGMPAGEVGPDGSYPADTVFGRVAAQLEAYDRALTERQRPV